MKVMKVVVVMVFVSLVLYIVWRIGLWLGLRLMGAIYAAKVSLAYGKKMSENVYYEAEFNGFMNQCFKDGGFMMTLDGVVKGFARILVSSFVVLVTGFYAILIIRKSTSTYLEPSVMQANAATAAFELVAAGLNVWIVLRNSWKIFRAYRDVVFKKIAEADVIGETRKAEMEILTK